MKKPQVKKVNEYYQTIETIFKLLLSTGDGEKGKKEPMASRKELIELVEAIAPAQMKLHADTEAIDLVSEVDELDLLEKITDQTTYKRVCLYLTSCVPYVPDPENTRLLETALHIFQKFEQYPQALRLALQLNDESLVRKIFLDCKDELMQKQLAYMLGRQHFFLADLDEDKYDEVIDIMSNTGLNQQFLNLARELDIMEPKAPEDVYKTHLDNVRPFGGSGAIDSARANLASSFVNGFVNACFGTDKLLIENGNKWLYKNRVSLGRKHSALK